MATLSKDKVREWKEQIEFANKVWDDAGMTGEEGDGLVNASTILDAYRLRLWKGVGLDAWGGFSGSELFEDPTFFSNINALMALLFSRNPEPEVFATNPKLLDSALKFQKFLLHAIRLPELKIKENWNAVLLDALLLKFGVIQYGFTPMNQKIDENGNLIDFYDAAQPDFPWMRRRAPWDVRIDPLVDDFSSGGDARWVAFRDLLTMEQVRKNPRLVDRKDLRATRKIEFDKITPDRQIEQSPEANDLVEVWTIWDKVERRVFAVSDGSDSSLMDPIEWPVPWKRLPYDILQFNKSPNSQFGVSYGESAIPTQMDLNKGGTIMTQLMKSLRRVIPINENAMDEADLAAWANDPPLIELMPVKGDPKSVIGQIQLGGNISELVGYMNELRGVQRQALGASEFDRAQRANVETATEAANIAQGGQVQRSRNQGPWEDFLSNSIEMFAQGIQFLVSQENRPRIVPILGNEDAIEIFGDAPTQQFIEITPKEVQGAFIYRVRPGSTLPEDPGEEQRKQAAFNQLMGTSEPLAQLTNWPQRAVDTTRAFDMDPKKQLAGQALNRATQEVQGQRAAQAGGIDPAATQQGSPPSQGVDPQLLQNLGRQGG